MDFELTEEQEALRQTVRRFLGERAPPAYVREMLDDDRGTTDQVWRGLADLGVTGLLVPEAHGGAGMGMVDVGVVLEELGRAVHPGPFLSSAVVGGVDRPRRGIERRSCRPAPRPRRRLDHRRRSRCSSPTHSASGARPAFASRTTGSRAPR